MENTSLPFILLVILISCVTCYEISKQGNLQDDKKASSSSDAVTYSAIPDFPLLKCYCGANHVWENQTCFPTNTTIEVSQEFGPITPIPTSEFSEVAVGRLKCENTSVTPQIISNVYLTEGKMIIHLESKKNFTHFCVEHVRNNEGEVVLEAYVCLPKKPLFKCSCAANHIWESEKCHPTNTSIDVLVQFSPFLQEKRPTSDYEVEVVGKPNCQNSSMNTQTISGVLLIDKTIFYLQPGLRFEHYCVENVKRSTGDVVLEAKVCIPFLGVPTCCPRFEFFNHSSNECYVDDNMTMDFQPHIKSISDPRIVPYLQDLQNNSMTQFFHRKLLNNETYLDLRKSEAYEVLLFFKTKGESSFPIIMSPLEYCVAKEQHMGTVFYSVLVFQDLPFYEYEPTLDKCDEIMTWLLLPLLSLSTFFLLTILVLHASMPELRKSVGSKNMICHVLSHFLGFCLLLSRYVKSLPLNCKIFVPMVQMCFLSTSFWLNVMCFDLWWKLRCRNPPGDTVESSKNRFIWYSFYAWGSPLLIVIITIIMDNIPPLESISGVIVPGFDRDSVCWFVDKKAALMYYFLIIAVLMVIDVVFFLWVFVVLIRANCTYEKVLKNKNKSAGRTWIYLKVFGVMGITWICEFISWSEGTCEYWVITDIINALRGLILVIIFCGNKKTIMKIKQRFSTMNHYFHDQFNRSVNSLRNLALKPPPTGTFDTSLDSRRPSEANSELQNRRNNTESENGFSKAERRRSSAASVGTES